MLDEIDTPPPPALPLSAAKPLQWLESHGDFLYRYAVMRVRRPDVAEDLVQETLLAAMKPAGGFSGRAEPRTWLTSILRNKISDHLRARYRREEHESSSAEDNLFFDRRGGWRNSVHRWDGDPAVIAESAEFRGVLDSCVAKLPGRLSHLLLSRIVDGVKTQTLCDELGTSPENVWTMLHRARSRLRQCLTVHWFADPPAAGLKRKKPCDVPSL